jgi:hypothetical protein
MLPPLAVSLLLSTLLLATSDARAATGRCYGAAALSHSSCPRTTRMPVVPSPAAAKHDKSPAYDIQADGKDCWAHVPAWPQRSCVFGHHAGRFRVALVGNSHAGQWLPPLQQIAAARGWKIVTFLASGCAFADVRQDFGTTARDVRCRTWVQRTRSRIAAGHYDLVVMADRMSSSVPGHTRAGSTSYYRAGYRRVLEALLHAGETVAVLRDTPAPGEGGIDSIPDCLAENPNDFTPCSAQRADWLPRDPSVGAVYDVRSRRATLSNFTGHICGPVKCWGAVGGVVVYVDGSHLTATYSRTLRPYLSHALSTTLTRAAR